MTENDPNEHEVAGAPKKDNRLATPNSCPACGSALQRKLFRTGSVQHPGDERLACPRCGTHK